MPSAILPASLPVPRPSDQSLSSCKALAGPNFFRPFALSPFSLAASGDHFPPSVIRMGGGPRTFPGGVSKWQWKRMQAQKAKQLLKARLCRERQLYEMRKRAELKAAISELERPWEVVERAPVLFSASADEQVKVLADRFQRPTGFDMWSERDGPQLFRSPDDLPSARFFPKGAVHSVKPYGIVTGEIPDGAGDSVEGDEKLRYNDWIARGAGGIGRGRRERRMITDSNSRENVMSGSGKLRDEDTGESQRSYYSDSELLLTQSSEEDDSSGGFNQFGQNRGSHGSDKERRVAGFSMEEEEVDGELGRENDRNRVSRLSYSKLALAGSNMDGYRMGGDFSVSGRRRNRGSPLNSGLTGSSRMEGPKLSSGFDRRGGRGGRGGRNGSRGSYQPNSVHRGTGSRTEGDGAVSDFNQRGARGHNRVSNSPNTEIGVAGPRMNGQEMAGSFSRRSVPGRRGGHRGSYRSYSEFAVDDYTPEEHMAGDFDRFGNHGRRRDVAGLGTEEDGIAGRFVRRGGRGRSFGNRGPYEHYSARSSVKGDMMAGGSGRRGGYLGSYGSDSEIALSVSRKTREMNGSLGRSRGGRGYKNTGSVSLRPTTELRLEEGGHRSRGPNWRESTVDGFSANPGRRRPYSNTR